jgi:tRNA U34 5-carboxymethylaminomethyl modifying GTPase MnmE/TrmE
VFLAIFYLWLAYIDFAESEEIEENVLDEVRKSVCQLRDEFERHLNDVRVGERLREGVHLVRELLC